MGILPAKLLTRSVLDQDLLGVSTPFAGFVEGTV
jgi:hypothetical protein